MLFGDERMAHYQQQKKQKKKKQKQLQWQQQGIRLVFTSY
jgi:hypothetical protein